MKVAVLAVLPPQEPLRSSAAAAIAGPDVVPDIPFEATFMPSNLQLDPTFSAVPLGPTTRPTANLDELAPDTSETFAVRAYIDVDHPSQIPESADGVPLYADPRIAPFITCGGTPPVGNAASVAAKLNIAATGGRGLDGKGIAIAILDTGINLAHLQQKLGRVPAIDAANSWTPTPGGTAPFGYPVDHGTMCAYDTLIAAPNATLLDYPVLSGSAPGGAISGQTLSVALQAFAQLIAFWAVAFAPGGAGKYGGLVVNNSWGIFHPSWDFPAGHPGRYIDNPNHPFTSIVSILARSGADILFAAGNCGSACADMRCKGLTTGTIMGANASPDVLTVAGCDINDQRVGYSSQGPSIVGMFQQKPDITAYTHFLGSEAFGANSPDSGTSAACPVAAGCIAAIRTKQPPTVTPPAALFAQLRTLARRQGGATGWNGDWGHGIIDPDATAQSLGI